MDGWRVLDLFAGSGALGLEAWSRGAHEVVWIESHPRTFAVLRENVRALCLPEAETTRHARCVRGDAMSLQRWGRQLGAFDLVLADPPYEAVRRENLPFRLLQDVPRAGLLRPGGYLVCETPAGASWPPHPAWEVLRTRRAGESQWTLLRLRCVMPHRPRPDQRHPVPHEKQHEHQDQQDVAERESDLQITRSPPHNQRGPGDTAPIGGDADHHTGPTEGIGGAPSSL